MSMMAMLLPNIVAFTTPMGRYPTIATRLAPPVLHEDRYDTDEKAFLARRAATGSRAAAPAASSALIPGPPVLTLEAADMMSNVALEQATTRGFNPISVCVLDASGRILVQKTMIKAGLLSSDYAQAKAMVCIGLQCSSRELRDKYINAHDGIGPKMPQALGMSIAGAAGGKAIAAFPGGVVCRDAAGNIVCAIGVSGAASDEDEHCSITAAKSVGLVTDPAQSQLA